MISFPKFLWTSLHLECRSFFLEKNRFGRTRGGTASSLLTFFNFLCAAIAMDLISLDWSSKPMAIAIMGMVGSTIPFAAILAMQRWK